jgi:hypothetical protein
MKDQKLKIFSSKYHARSSETPNEVHLAYVTSPKKNIVFLRVFDDYKIQCVPASQRLEKAIWVFQLCYDFMRFKSR